jgi:hypothetical protein
MKKLLLAFTMILSLFIYLPYVQGAPELVEYDDLTFYNDQGWDLDTGTWVSRDKYYSTNRELIITDNLSVGTDVHHVLFWTSTNSYIGYYNVSSTYEGSRYLGTQADGEFATLPANASKFAIQLYDILEINVEGTIYDLEEVYTGGSYLYYEFGDTPIPIGDAFSTTDSFRARDYNLIPNGYFDTDVSEWSLETGTSLTYQAEYPLEVYNEFYGPDKGFAVIGSYSTPASFEIRNYGFTETDTTTNDVMYIRGKIVLTSMRLPGTVFYAYIEGNTSGADTIELFTTVSNIHMYEFSKDFITTCTGGVDVLYFYCDDPGNPSCTFYLDELELFNLTEMKDDGVIPYDDYNYFLIYDQGYTQLENLISNGDFSEGINDWSLDSVIYYIIDNSLYLFPDRLSLPRARQTLSIIYNHIYYLSFNWYQWGEDNIEVLGQNSSFAITVGEQNIEQGGHYHNVITATADGSYIQFYKYRAAPLDPHDYFYISNCMFFDLTVTFEEGNEPYSDDFENILDIHNAPEYFDTYDIFDAEKYIKNPLWHFIADYDDYTYWYQLWRDAVDEVYRDEFFEHLGGLTEEVYNEYLPIYTDLAPQYADIAVYDFLITEPYGYREELVPYVPPTAFEKIDTFITDLGLGAWGYALIIFLTMGLMALVLALLHIRLLIILIVEGALFIMFTIFGWISAWISILILVILVAVIVISIKSS